MKPFFTQDYIIGNSLTDFIKSNNLKIRKKSLKYYKNILDELLEISIRNNDIKYAQLLINYGANINYIYEYYGQIINIKYNLLSIALEKNNIKIIRFLISNGISLNPKFSLYTFINVLKNRIIKYIIKYNIFSYAKINAHIRLKYNKIIKQNNILNKKYNIIIYIC
jgi:ankyrin repeat protein